MFSTAKFIVLHRPSLLLVVSAVLLEKVQMPKIVDLKLRFPDNHVNTWEHINSHAGSGVLDLDHTVKYILIRDWYCKVNWLIAGGKLARDTENSC